MMRPASSFETPGRNWTVSSSGRKYRDAPCSSSMTGIEPATSGTASNASAASSIVADGSTYTAANPRSRL